VPKHLGMMGTWNVPLPPTRSYSKLIITDDPNCHLTKLLRSTVHW